MKKLLLPLISLVRLVHAAPTSTSSGNRILAIITNFPNCVVETFFNFLITGLESSIQNFVNLSFKLMFATPNPHWFCTPYNVVINVLEGFFSIALMALALFFIVRANDAEGRATAKKWLENLLILIIVLSFSFGLFQIILDVNSYLTANFANQSMQNVFNVSSGLGSSIFALVMLAGICMSMFLTLSTLLIRYVSIPFLLLLFPIAIFLYFIPVTQSLGKVFLKLIVAVIFMTTIDALIIFGLTSLFNAPDPNLADAVIRALLVLFGFSLLGIVNLFVFFVPLFSVVVQNKAAKTIVQVSKVV